MLNLTSHEQKTIIFVLSLLILGMGLDFFKKVTNRDSLLDYETMEEKLFDKVDINKAKVLEFTSIPGVGEKLAQAIVDYRESNGKFKNIEDLKKIKGIKDKKLEKLKKYIKLEIKKE